MSALERAQRGDRRHHTRIPIAYGQASIGSESGDARPLPLLDFSPEGVALRTPGPPSWADGQTQLVLRLGGEPIACRAHVARVSKQSDGQICGLRLGFEDADCFAVAQTYHRLRFAELRRRGSLDERMLHELLVASGYTRLKDDIAPSAIWLRAPWPNTLTHEAVYVARDQRALGHVTVTRAYSKTWLGHEIATLRNHPEAMACRRTLYQHFSVWPRLLDGDDAHLLGYYDRTRPWHQRMFEGFADRCGDQDCLVLPMERYALDRPSDASEDDQQGGLSAGASVARAGISDAEWVAELVGKHWPGLVLRAFDIHPDRLTAECMHPAYRTAHLRRARDVLVLRVREQPVGAALCEWSDSRISLFNVLNMAQIFIESDADVPAEARNLLVQRVRAFYGDLGTPPPMLVCPPGTFGEAGLQGCRMVETMGCIVWSSEGLRQYESYVAEAMPAAQGVSSEYPAQQEPLRVDSEAE